MLLNARYLILGMLLENSVKCPKDEVICSCVEIINKIFVKYIMIYTLFWLSWEKDGIKLRKEGKRNILGV